jgi:2'-5' RNA ligase
VLVETVPDAREMRDHWWWRPGWAPGARHLQWHLTFEGQEALARRVLDIQRTVAGIEVLEPVPVPWLHLTLVGLGNAACQSDDDVHAAITSAHRRLDGMPAMTLAFGRVVVFEESVVLAPDASQPLTDLHAALVDSLRDVADSAPPAVVFTPHLSVAYAKGVISIDAVTEAISRDAGPPVTSVRPTLSLVELERDCQQYRWRLVHAYPL